MNRKNLILTVVFGVAMLIGVGVAVYMQSFKTVRLEVKQADMSVKVHSQNRTEVGAFTGSKELRLQEGKYTATPQGDQYDTTPIPFEVIDKDISVTLAPSFSDIRLAELLRPEQAVITKKIVDAYPGVINGFHVRDGRLYKEGEWYATILVQKTQGAGDEPDLYRIVLKKEDGQWVIKTKPAIVLSAKEYPDIPFYILSSINRRPLYE